LIQTFGIPSADRLDDLLDPLIHLPRGTSDKSSGIKNLRQIDPLERIIRTQSVYQIIAFSMQFDLLGRRLGMSADQFV
jgi:hypothetical protein